VVAFGQNALRGTGLFFLTLYLLFFFLRDGARLLERIVGGLPIGDARERRLFQKFAEVSRATIKGTIVIGLVQGLLGGLIFWILGIEAAALWGVVMAVLSFLPAVGAALVWVPAAALLIATGRLSDGLLLLVFGTVIIGLADNVLRPILVGRDTEMPDYLVLITTLGGLAAFGLSGVVIGPLSEPSSSQSGKCLGRSTPTLRATAVTRPLQERPAEPSRSLLPVVHPNLPGAEPSTSTGPWWRNGWASPRSISDGSRLPSGARAARLPRGAALVPGRKGHPASTGREMTGGGNLRHYVVF
jgi:Predicted permease